MTCPHDRTELVAYDPELNPAKAGRSFCPACGCSFNGAGLVTTGAGCGARMLEPARLAGAVVEEQAETTEEQEEAPRPRSRRRAES